MCRKCAKMCRKLSNYE
ncbi:MAG TPA: four-helix bundle copper-binding protein [Candidatus Gemmiger excrementavium]|uniref:Four-helix bundle copper-binding protein n=1 Tax=Candidatus Gemmiger excrementavium TaxID=2838608 RepID=A0A9D2F225_9FIRM|nr:four-helix bundle copper-binding protein [Clostridiales bacterium]HIZ47928.1 four-helix bundle copper-binding protein [Candidatus Gemmiger excrementavium]